MKVQKKKGKRLDEFAPGECFYDEEGDLYLVTDNWNKSIVQCVNLEDGSVWDAEIDAVYAPVHCEVITQ